MSALPIFPGRFQPSIFGANELNYRVRDGNGWTLSNQHRLLKEKRLCVSLKREKEYSIPLQKLQALFLKNFRIFSLLSICAVHMLDRTDIHAVVIPRSIVCRNRAV